MASFRQIVTPWSFFGFQANLGQSGNRIPDAWSVILIFSLAVTLYLTNTANRTKNLKHSPDTDALSKGTIFAPKNIDFLQKNADI